MSEIVNRVKASGIITLDLEELIPETPQSFIDIKDQLFHGLIPVSYTHLTLPTIYSV